MKSQLKKAFKSFLLKRGKVIKPYDPTEEKVDQVRYDWLKKRGVNTIIDVGASDGGFASRSRLLFPKAQIYSIEALENSYEKLVKRFEGDKKFKAFNIGVSDREGKTSFFLCDNNTGSSSLLKMGDLHKEAYPHTSKNTEIHIDVTTMDQLFEKEIVEEGVLLKLDVQGAELLVLKGAESLLKKVSVIFTEISFNELYENSVLFETLQDYLRNFGFVVQGLENVSQSTVDGTFLQADVFFVKK